MFRTSPLTDCTRDTLQAMNRHAGMSGSSTLAKSAKVKRHDPYASKLLAPEDSVEFNSSILSSPLSSRPSPLNWEARAFEPSCLYSNLSTPYVGQSFASVTMDAQVRRSLFGDSPAALAVHQFADSPAVDSNYPTANANLYNSLNSATHPMHHASPHAAPLTLTSPATKPSSTPAGGAKKAIGKVYVGGRPVVVPRYDNEVSVRLRCGEAAFVIADIYSLLAHEEDTRDLVGLSVLVEGDRGEDLGVITALVRAEGGNAAAASTPSKSEAEADKREKSVDTEKEKSAGTAAKALPRVLRVATSAELQQKESLTQLEAEALEYCHACLAEVQLTVPITVEGVVFQFDRKKLTVRYTSDAYVDFNDLTRMLHKKYNCRIWMDQLNREAVSGNEKRSSRRNEHNGKKTSGNHSRKAAQKRKE